MLFPFSRSYVAVMGSHVIECSIYIPLHTSFRNNILPTYAKQHGNDRSQQVCPECRRESETQYHFFRCSDANCVDLRVIDLNSSCRVQQTRPDRRSLLLRALRSWYSDGTNLHPGTDWMDHQGRYSKVAQGRKFDWMPTDIQWALSAEWSILQEHFYDRRLDAGKRSKYTTGDDRWRSGEHRIFLAAGRLRVSNLRE